jgi:hypothetical protein
LAELIHAAGWNQKPFSDGKMAQLGKDAQEFLEWIWI